MIGIQEFMCSDDCPCKDVPTKTDWNTLTYWDKRDLPCKEWNFTGKYNLLDTTRQFEQPDYTTYKQCIMGAKAISDIDARGF